MKMTKILTILCLGVFVLQAQDITNKLGGDTANETYDVTDSANNVLFRVQGDGKVGIGTETPDANWDVHGTVKAFGAWALDAYFTETAYQASTDGFILARISNALGNPFGRIIGYTDSNNPPTTEVIRQTINVPVGSGNTIAITMPVKKGDYFLISDGNSGANTVNFYINWIPLGQ
ncbi:MAG: hypothetical protein GWP19_13120 [Planctomycetia bacterium]|nr:hypothetical protein [Planctomycetia bacterium]